MAQQASVTSISEAEQNVVFGCVSEYISDIRTLVSLSLVSKCARSAIYRSNGLRELTYESRLAKLNEVIIRSENREEKLKDGLRWIWTVGKRLKTVCLIRHNCQSSCFCYSVIPLFSNLATTEKRRIETIKIHNLSCEIASVLVRESRHTLRRLCFESKILNRCLAGDEVVQKLTRCSLSEPPEQSENFWSVVQQCDRLESLDLLLSKSNDPIFPVNLVYVLRHTPLKHLGLGFNNGLLSESATLQEFVGVLSVRNLRDNLESLKFDYHISISFLLPLVEELTCLQSPVVFVNITELTFDFLRVCCGPDLINWLAFYTVFPALHVIKNSLWDYTWFEPNSCLSHNFASFCKTYLEILESRSCEIQIELPPHSVPNNMIVSVVKAATLPEDQDWCISHGVQIETETRDGKVKRVTLRKDTSTLVFDFAY